MQIKENLLGMVKMLGVVAFGILLLVIMSFIFKLVPESVLSIVNSQEPHRYRSLYMMLAIAIQFIMTVFPMIALIKVVYKIPVKRIGILLTPKWPQHFLYGLALGCAPMFIIWGFIVIAGGYDVKINPISLNAAFDLLLFIPMIMLGSYLEEVMYRGTIAYAGRNTFRLLSIIMVSLIFAFLHSGSNDPIAFTNLALLSIVLTQCTWITGDLWMAIGCHAAWNFVQGGILGVPTSGTVFTSILTSEASTNTALNGGNFGIEGSIPATIILAVTVLLIGMGWIRKKRVNPEPVADWLYDVQNRK